MKVLELFSGYGTASFALKRLGIDFELVGYSDIDKYANQCFWQNHWKEIKPLRITGNPPFKEFGDIRKINPNDIEDFDLLTGGFPCQAFSVAGKGLGEIDPRGTLFYEIIRIAEVKKPKYMLLENVKGLTTKKHKPTFDKILSELDKIGYNVYWKVLNSKDFGIPQSRARIWFVCFRKDIDTKDFKWPEQKELKIFIKDILEKNVEDKYYLSPMLQERFAKYLEDKESKIIAMRQRDRHGLNEERTQQLEPREDGCSNSLTSVQKDNLVAEINVLGSLDSEGWEKRHEEIRRIYGTNGIMCTLPTGQGGGVIPKIYDRVGFESRKEGFKESELSPTLSRKMGTGGNNVPMVLQLCGDRDKPMLSIKEDIANTVNANSMSDRQQVVANCLKSRDYKGIPSIEYVEKKDFNLVGCLGKLRRLTPKECFRLMGFLNDEINLDGLSDTQKYKLAGNGQDVNMVSLIFKQMFQQEVKR